MTASSNGEFRIGPSAEHPGWLTFDAPDPAGFNVTVLGPLLIREDGDGAARVRMCPGRQTTNVRGDVHGGALLGFIDVSLFGALKAITGREPAAALTLDLTTQFIASAQIAQPLEARVELLRETGRLAFLRGVVEQGDMLVASFQGTVRKLGGTT